MNPFVAIGRFFKKLFGWVIKSDPFKVLVANLLPVAIDVVTELASVKALSSAEKRERAIATLKDAAEIRGLQFADHMIALLVELAVARLKGTLAPE